MDGEWTNLPFGGSFISLMLSDELVELAGIEPATS
jgi:hypothetical protein